MVTSIILLFALAASAWIDATTFRLPDRITLPLLAAGLGVAAWRAGAVPWPEVAGAAAGLAVFAAIGAAFWRWRGTDGLGLGDAKLLGAGGAWVGVSLLPLVVLVAALSALAFVLVSGRDRTAPLPFGPWLALGIAVGWGVRLWGG